MLKRVVVSMVLALAVIVVPLSTPQSVHAASTCTWVGGSSTNWSDSANWSGCSGDHPQNGDALAFDISSLSSPSDGLLLNDLPNLQVGSINYTGTSMYGYTIHGNNFSLSGGISDSSVGGFNTINVGITFTSDQTVAVDGLFGLGTASTNINIGSHTITISGDGTTDFNGLVVGDGTLKFSGASGATAFLFKNNIDFTGHILIQSGRVIINASTPAALGSSAVTVTGSGILQESFNTASSYTLGNDITLEGDGGGNNGALNFHDFTGSTSTVTLTGKITLTGNAKIDLDNANAIVKSRPTGCGYTITKSGGSSGSGGSLTGNLTGQCDMPASGYTWTQQTSAGSKDWQNIAMSADGKYVITASWNAHVVTSNDYGVTWVDRTSAGTRNWVAVAVSADGSHMAAGENGGHLYTSSDFGNTWTDRTALGSGDWQDMAMSADGSRIAIAAYGGDIWTSGDYGATWIDRTSAGTRNWNSIRMSADGVHLAAAADGGDIYTSSDSGATWTDRSAAGARTWGFLAMSADGSRLAATVLTGDIYTSSNYGATWIDQTSAGYSDWRGIAMSADGSHLVALENNGDVWTSSDYGVTWIDPPGIQNWYSVAMSADGSRVAATASPGYIWTAYDPSLSKLASVIAPKTGAGAPGYRLVLAGLLLALSLLLVYAGWRLRSARVSSLAS